MPDSEATNDAELVELNVNQSALSEADKEAFAAAERRAMDGSYDLSHKTVREIIDEQKAFEGSGG